MHVRVETDAGRRGDKTPRRFELRGRTVEVEDVLDQWTGKDYRYFKLKGGDGNLYILRHDETAGEWELTLYETPRGSAISVQPSAPPRDKKRRGKPH